MRLMKYIIDRNDRDIDRTTDQEAFILGGGYCDGLERYCTNEQDNQCESIFMWAHAKYITLNFNSITFNNSF